MTYVKQACVCVACVYSCLCVVALLLTAAMACTGNGCLLPSLPLPPHGLTCFSACKRSAKHAASCAFFTMAFCLASQPSGQQHGIMQQHVYAYSLYALYYNICITCVVFNSNIINMCMAGMYAMTVCMWGWICIFLSSINRGDRMGTGHGLASAAPASLSLSLSRST